MGHILGLVETTGSKCSNDCPNTGDTSYTCPKALAEYNALGLENTLRLENDGGGGTKCKHWDEDSFAIDGSSELMTGGFEAGLYQPISRMTVAALDDLGVYGPLNYAAADPYPATRRKLEEGPGFGEELARRLEEGPARPAFTAPVEEVRPPDLRASPHQV